MQVLSFSHVVFVFVVCCAVNIVDATATSSSLDFGYHEHTAMTTYLQSLPALYPNLITVSSIGQSVGGRELWVAEVTSNIGQASDKPKILQSHNMHGDEKVGREVALHMIEYLCSQYATNATIKFILDTTRVFILPSMNPDGATNGVRYNQNGVDLNRDFPDVNHNPADTTSSKQPETVAMMNFLKSHTLAQAFNTHGGDLVCNYPLDSAPSGTTQYTYYASKDDQLFVQLCTLYATTHHTMATSSGFPGGITNGFEWYEVSGGLQDYSYLYRGTPHVTLELGYTKTPSASTLATEWDNNRDAMVAYTLRVHGGVWGIVTDSCGNRISANISITVQSFAKADEQEQEDQSLKRGQRDAEARRKAVFEVAAQRGRDEELLRRRMKWLPGQDIHAFLAQAQKQDRIVGGSSAALGEFPYAARLTLSDSSGSYLCGGSLIHKDWILTAAHCAIGMTSVTAKIGGLVLTQSSQFETRTSTELHVHPNYNANTMVNDVALIKLSTSSSITAFATPVFVLSSAEIAAYMASGSSATVIGWGATSEGGSQSNTLLKVDVPIDSDSTCSNSYGSGYISSSMFCAGPISGGLDSCQGDSGGPIVATSNKYIQLGVVSWGSGCARANYPGIYSRLSALSSFVLSYVSLVTPSLTPTISITPSITPTISVSPSFGTNVDCLGNLFTIASSTIGDGNCDVNYGCAKFNYDGGDCMLDCNGNLAPSTWLGDSYCDNGAYSFNGVSIYLNCATYNCDVICTCATSSVSRSPSAGAISSSSSKSATPSASRSASGSISRASASPSTSASRSGVSSSRTSSGSVSRTASASVTPSASMSASRLVTVSPSTAASPSRSSSASFTPSRSSTASGTASSSLSRTPTSSRSASVVFSVTSSSSRTVSATPTSSATPSTSLSGSRSASPTITSSVTRSPSQSPSPLVTTSQTTSVTVTQSRTASGSPTRVLSLTATSSRSQSPSPSPSANNGALDCNGHSFPSTWLGDGTCDYNNYAYGGYLINLACSQFNYDAGDCVADCNGNIAPSYWVGDGTCDNDVNSYHSVSINLDCGALNCDGGDCGTGSCPGSQLQSLTTDSVRGDYHRMLMPGRYTLVVASAGCVSQTVSVVVPSFVSGTTAVRADVQLSCATTCSIGTCATGSPNIPINALIQVFGSQAVPPSTSSTVACVRSS